MYSNHSCKGFIPTLTPDAEHVCSKCGIVLEEKVEMQYLTGTQLRTSSIQICDENRHGSENISPDGFTGENLLLTAQGKLIELPAATTMTVNKGDQLIIKTPGGGGYG